MTSFIEQQQQISKDTQFLVIDDDKPKRSLTSRICRSKACKGVFCVLLFSAIVPVLLFFLLLKDEDTTLDVPTCVISDHYRVPCGVPGISKSKCGEILCCYDANNNECYHYLPSTYSYNPLEAKDGVYMPSQRKTPFGNPAAEELTITLVEQDENNLEIILHDPLTKFESKKVSGANYRTTVYTKELYVDVRREQTDDLIFTSAKGPLIASDGFWEWTFQLSTDRLYGLGEISFEENTTYTKVIYRNKHDHNTMPIFMAHLNGKFHGLIVHHTGPLEVTVLPSKLVILRSFLGQNLAVTLSLGPTPAEVMLQQRITHPFVPPLWALGAHICRTGSTTISSALEEYNSFRSNENNTVDYASDCIHEDLLSLLGNTTEKERALLSSYIVNLRNNSHFVISVAPQLESSENNLLFEKASSLNMLYKYEDKIFNGVYKEKPVAYPDFLNGVADEFLETFVSTLPEEGYDGLVLTSNWPAEESYTYNNENIDFPYLSPMVLSSMSSTIPWNAIRSNNETHILTHNSYGSSQAAFLELISQSFLMSSSYSYGDPYATHVENVNISWADLRAAIRTTLYHSIFGTPISIPVCGSTSHYNPETHENVCMRWYIFAATSPIFRISSDWPRRDPTALASGFARGVAEDAIRKRRRLLPYFYSVLSAREPLLRPMFYEFYGDEQTLDLTEQYMVGSCLLVAQPLADDVTFLDVYLPPSEGWYEFWGGKRVRSLGWMRTHVLQTDWITFIVAGNIIPMYANNDRLTLAIALNCTDDGCSANGTLNLNPQTAILFSGNETGVIIGNVFGTLGQLECEDAEEGLTVISGAEIFGLDEYLVSSNFTEVDLCEIDADEVFIGYFR